MTGAVRGGGVIVVSMASNEWMRLGGGLDSKEFGLRIGGMRNDLIWDCALWSGECITEAE